jgi:hypothetical protein
MHRSISLMFKIATATALVVGAPVVSANGQPNVSWSISVGSGPVYAPPQVVYVTPQPVYVQPRPVYIQPHPVYVQPRPVYVQPHPVYIQPHPVYAQPQPVYVQPRPIFVQPQPVYVQPYPVYGQARAVIYIGTPYYEKQNWHKKGRPHQRGHARDYRY